MTKADKLRAAGKDAGAEGLSAAQIIKIAGHQANISPMVKTGEFTIKETADGKRYIYNAAFTKEQRTARQLPVKRRKKKPTRKPAKKHTARIRKIAEAITTAPPLSHLALQQLIAASKLLRTTVANQVEALDTNPLLIGALHNAERAELLAEAA